MSVILPTYDRADVLPESVRSVLCQTYEDFELIVVDDASTDDTDEVVRGFDDDRIEYHKHEENRGAPAARNTGLAEAEGKYVAFQDSDDAWLPGKLEKQVRAFRNAPASVGVVYTGMVRREGGTQKYLPYRGVERTSGDVRDSLARQNFISTPVAMVRRAVLDGVGGFDENAWPLSDWELWIRISEQYRFELVDEILVVGEVRGDSISTNTRATVEARRRIVENHREFFDDASLSRQLFYVGHGFMKLGDVRESRTYLVRAVRVAPDPLYVFALVLSFFGSVVYNRVYRYYTGR